MQRASLFLAFPLALFLSACHLDQPVTPVDDGTVALRAPKPSASGQAGILIGEHVQHFSFHAQLNSDGTVSGSWESKSPSQDIRAHGEITCLEFEGTNEAYLVGFITHFTLGEDPVFVPEIGDEIWFNVIDNGEGNNSPPDLFSDWYWFGGNNAPCFNFSFPMIEIVTGNIQVKP